MTTVPSAGMTSFSLKGYLDSTSVSMIDSLQRKERVLHIKRAKEGILNYGCQAILSLIMEPHGHAQLYHLEKQHRPQGENFLVLSSSRSSLIKYVKIMHV